MGKKLIFCPEKNVYFNKKDIVIDVNKKVKGKVQNIS